MQAGQAEVLLQCTQSLDEQVFLGRAVYGDASCMECVVGGAVCAYGTVFREDVVCRLRPVFFLGLYFQYVAYGDRVEHRFQVMIAVRTAFRHIQSEVYFSVGIADHGTVF